MPDSRCSVVSRAATITKTAMEWASASAFSRSGSSVSQVAIHEETGSSPGLARRSRTSAVKYSWSPRAAASARASWLGEGKNSWLRVWSLVRDLSTE